MRESVSMCIRKSSSHLCGRIRISVAVSCHLSGPPHVVVADGLPPNAGCGLLKSLHALVHFLCQRMKE